MDLWRISETIYIRPNYKFVWTRLIFSVQQVTDPLLLIFLKQGKRYAIIVLEESANCVTAAGYY